MINSKEEILFDNEQSHTHVTIQNNELMLSLIRELNAALAFHNDGVTSQLEIKHTFPMGVGMFES